MWRCWPGGQTPTLGGDQGKQGVSAMAKKTTVTLIDDLDKSLADETMEFALDGKSYEIDLSTANASKLRKLLAPFVAGARKAGRRTYTSPSSTPRLEANRERNHAIREWAREQGMDVPERGRIRAEIVEAYENRDRGAAAPAAKAPHDRQASVTPIRPATPVASVRGVDDPAVKAAAAVESKAPKAPKAGKTSNGLPKVAPKPKGVKVKTMTAMQTKAVEDMKISTHEVAKTFVVFAAATPEEVLGLIRAAMQSYDGDTTGGSYVAMKSVIRKLEAADPKQVQIVEVAA